MRIRLVIALAALSIAVGLAGIAACGKDSKNPTGGGGGGSGELASQDPITFNGTYEHTFTNLGEYHYHCNHHTFMHGVVRVSDSEPAGDKTVEINTSAYILDDITIHSGNKVTWTNKDASIPHTVTSD